MARQTPLPLPPIPALAHIPVPASGTMMSVGCERAALALPQVLALWGDWCGGALLLRGFRRNVLGDLGRGETGHGRDWGGA